MAFVANQRMFPLGKTGGLIEALRVPTWALPTWAPAGVLFPLGKTGGLIEAQYGQPYCQPELNVSAG